MADNVLKYLGIVWAAAEEMEASMDNAVSDADNGENTTMEEGKERAISQVEVFIDKLNILKVGITKLSLKNLQAKYNR